jgi:hypothetical protein
VAVEAGSAVVEEVELVVAGLGNEVLVPRLVWIDRCDE